PAAEDGDPTADPEEGRRQPRGPQEARVDQPPPAARWGRQTLMDRMGLGRDDRGHDGPFCAAHAANAPSFITITRERIKAWPTPQSSVQMTGYVPMRSGVMWRVGWMPGTTSCFCPNSGTQKEWITSFDVMCSTTERLTGRRRMSDGLLPYSG